MTMVLVSFTQRLKGEKREKECYVSAFRCGVLVSSVPC